MSDEHWAQRIADCDPSPTSDDPWCFFCGEPSENDPPHIDGCLWLAAVNATTTAREETEEP